MQDTASWIPALLESLVLSVDTRKICATRAGIDRLREVNNYACSRELPLVPPRGNYVVTDQHTCLRALKLAVPALTIHSVEPLQPGWDSTVFLVNHHWVFRFPLRPEVARALEREIQLLPLIAANTGIAVPQFEFVAPPNQFSAFPFVGYPRLPGDPLSTAIDEFDSRARTTIAQQIGQFLRDVHQLSFEPGRRAGLSAFSPIQARDERRALFRFAIDVAESQLTKDQMNRIRDYVHSLFDQIDWLDIRPAMIHGDLGSEHILVNGRRDVQVSIIDFGDLCFDDPAADFTGLPDALLPAALESYGLGLGSDVAGRRALYQALVPAYAIEAGQRLNRPDLTEEGIEGYRELAARIP